MKMQQIHTNTLQKKWSTANDATNTYYHIVSYANDLEPSNSCPEGLEIWDPSCWMHSQAAWKLHSAFQSDQHPSFPNTAILKKIVVSLFREIFVRATEAFRLQAKCEVKAFPAARMSIEVAAPGSLHRVQVVWTCQIHHAWNRLGCKNMPNIFYQSLMILKMAQCSSHFPGKRGRFKSNSPKLQPTWAVFLWNSAHCTPNKEFPPCTLNSPSILSLKMPHVPCSS